MESGQLQTEGQGAGKPAIDFAPVDGLIAKYGKGLEATIPLLQGIQAELGYLPVEALEHVSEATGIPASHLYGVATFYRQFRLTPMGKNMIRVCLGTACHVQGGGRVLELTRETLEMAEKKDTTEDLLFTVEPVACLGCCSLAPVVMVNGTVHGKLDAPKTRRLVRKIKKEEEKKLS